MGSLMDNFKRGYSLLMKTMPYVGMRLVIYGVYGLGTIVYFIITFLLAKLFGGAGGIVMLVALGVFGAFFYWSRRYLLYMVKVGHVAVFTELYAKFKELKAKAAEALSGRDREARPQPAETGPAA